MKKIIFTSFVLCAIVVSASAQHAKQVKETGNKPIATDLVSPQPSNTQVVGKGKQVTATVAARPTATSAVAKSAPSADAVRSATKANESQPTASFADAVSKMEQSGTNGKTKDSKVAVQPAGKASATKSQKN